jgi:hypothetical protein
MEKQKETLGSCDILVTVLGACLAFVFFVGILILFNYYVLVHWLWPGQSDAKNLVDSMVMMTVETGMTLAIMACLAECCGCCGCRRQDQDDDGMYIAIPMVVASASGNHL